MFVLAIAPSVLFDAAPSRPAAAAACLLWLPVPELDVRITDWANSRIWV